MLIERLLAPIFPAWALRRIAQQRAVRGMLARYDAARNGRRTRGWQASSDGPRSEVDFALATLRDRSRDLVRNNPYASAGLDMLVAYQVGTGIVGRSATGEPGLDKEVDALFAAWSARCDIAGRLDFAGVQAQVARTRAEAGEALAMLVPLSTTEMRATGAPVPLALRVMEPDHIGASAAGFVMTSGTPQQGIEIDGNGRPVAYWLHTEHPGEGGLQGLTGSLTRVPAQRILHLFRQDRPGQLRGVPDLTPVMTRLRMLDEYEDAALEQAKVQACLAAFVTSAAGPARGALEGTDDAGDQVKTFAPGMIERLLPGEDVKFAQPSGQGDFSAFAAHQLRAVATGFGLTYDLLTGDLSQANYSSLRAGRLAFKRRLEQAQWLMLVPRFCEPVWRAFIDAALVAGRLPPRAGGYPARWAPPRFEMVDPNKDTAAVIAQVRAGLMTWGQAVAEQGWDPQMQADEIREWDRIFDARGLILDTDPRRTGNGGSAQDTRQNAAFQIAANGAAAPATTQDGTPA